MDPVERLAELNRLTDYDGRGDYVCHSEPPPGDPVLRAALALMDQYGLHYDPSLCPETLIEMAEIVLGSALTFTQVGWVCPGGSGTQRMLENIDHPCKIPGRLPVFVIDPEPSDAKLSTCETCDKPIWTGDRFCIEHAAAEFDADRAARVRAQS